MKLDNISDVLNLIPQTGVRDMVESWSPQEIKDNTDKILQYITLIGELTYGEEGEVTKTIYERCKELLQNPDETLYVLGYSDDMWELHGFQMPAKVYKSDFLGEGWVLTEEDLAAQPKKITPDADNYEFKYWRVWNEDRSEKIKAEAGMRFYNNSSIYCYCEPKENTQTE